MNDFNEQLNRWMAMPAFQSAKDFYGASAETMEKIARQNYEVLGDWMDFAVQQTKLPTEVVNANDYAGKQMELTRAFGQKLTERFLGYVDIARNVQAKAAETVTSEIKKAA